MSSREKKQMRRMIERGQIRGPHGLRLSINELEFKLIDRLDFDIEDDADPDHEDAVDAFLASRHIDEHDDLLTMLCEEARDAVPIGAA